MRLCWSVKPICHHIIGWHKNRKMILFVLYWKCVIDLQIKVLLCVLFICEGNLKLQILDKLLSCYFIIYEHYNYARWLTMHCFDLFIINTKFLEVYQGSLPSFKRKLLISNILLGIFKNGLGSNRLWEKSVVEQVIYFRFSPYSLGNL